MSTGRDHPLRGLRVTAWIDDLELVELTGVLLDVALDGEVTIRCDDGQERRGWPVLDMRAAAPRWEPGDDAPWPVESSWPDGPPPRAITDIHLPGDGPEG